VKWSPDDRRVTPRLRNERKFGDSESNWFDRGAVNLDPIEALI
jgi:hypothetical protein